MHVLRSNMQAVLSSSGWPVFYPGPELDPNILLICVYDFVAQTNNGNDSIAYCPTNTMLATSLMKIPNYSQVPYVTGEQDKYYDMTSFK